ncbi:Crp/Fnr family transcriptional regulator [Streptomyces smyrnaeus]|uniref:Crp/Fnr family transcriptional regulator n=1 Tax=Streptomyces smyrnaeus TaxID=1387713 RepID=A0ABS3XR33_9ACTN|nr:Crp/Fnr family transcriptional regulator [Streptomyces smyrnaeus]MBO8197761.1 Crp/Fnr family transcriptional regulator [Streptomyces smyrnaeus]
MRDFIGDEAWADLLTRSTRRRHRAGALLLRQGEPGTHVLAMLSGVAKVMRHEPDGNLTLLAFRGPGELLGEVAVLDDGVRSASVEAMSQCDVGVVDKPAFLRFATESKLFPLLVKYALSRLRESDQARAGGDLVGRLAATLVRLADIAGETVPCGACSLELALTRDDLAQHLRVSRNTVSSVLTGLSEYVQVSRKRIVIDDLPALRRVALADASRKP